MKVKLISYSKPSDELVNEGIEDVQDLIAFCARVSNPANQYNSETAEKLIKYLIKHAHWSPLEMASACLEIETTRDIAHQIVRHRSFAFQEFSQRYADPTKELNFVLREARLQDTKNRQNSIAITEEDIMTSDTAAELVRIWEQKQNYVIAAAEDAYKWAVDNGIAKEQARAVLPEGLTSTRLYMNGTLRSWIHYIEVRSANGTQKEHMDIAKECACVIASIFSLVSEFVGE
jgi:thymidylate synthase (FAD)